MEGSSESQQQDDKAADIDDAASETTTAVDQDEDQSSSSDENRLGLNWNARGEDSYVFEYRHAQSSMVFRIRVGRMGGRIQIDGMAEVSTLCFGGGCFGPLVLTLSKDGAPNTISLLLTELLNPSAFPIPGSATATGSSSNSSEAPAEILGFQSLARYVASRRMWSPANTWTSVTRFIDQYKRDIIAKLIPGLQVDGYSEPLAILNESARFKLIHLHIVGRHPAPAQVQVLDLETQHLLSQAGTHLLDPTH